MVLCYWHNPMSVFQHYSRRCFSLMSTYTLSSHDQTPPCYDPIKTPFLKALKQLYYSLALEHHH